VGRNRTLDHVICYIEENICSKLTVEDIAAKAYISPAHLQRLFHITFGMTIAEYVRSRKLQKALELLYNTDRKVCDIAYDVGFEHESSFIRSFKREFGVTPHEARKHPFGIKLTPPRGFGNSYSS
jgi:AraC family transcriptional regulator